MSKVCPDLEQSSATFLTPTTSQLPHLHSFERATDIARGWYFHQETVFYLSAAATELYLEDIPYLLNIFK